MTKKRLSLFQPIDLTEGTCWKTIFLFSIPIIISYLLQQIYTISDAAIVGQTLAADEVAGVNDTVPHRVHLPAIRLRRQRGLLRGDGAERRRA